MKTTTITTPTHEIMLVELPEGFEPTRITSQEGSFDWLCYKPIGQEKFTKICKSSEYKPLGFVSDLKESEVEDYVEKVMQGQHFQNYKVRQNNNLPDWSSFIWVKTALESFLSLLETKVMWVNPFGNEPILQEWSKGKFVIHEPKEFERQKAQSHTFDKERTLVLVKGR